jgi:hypothetical protein
MRIVLLILSASIFLFACKKDKGSDNPYDDWRSNPKDPVVQDKPIDPNTIQGLHKNIFKPTCSNSGCHDGNFEPDFRTIESTYNSLINRNSINTDPNNTQYALRVVPNDADRSMIVHRLSTFIPGSQGVMPLSVDPGSDWTEKKDEYIQNIKNWINDGAKDQFGNDASDVDFTPQLGGLIAFANSSSTPIGRSGFNPIEIPASTNSIKLMVAYKDDKTAVNQFGTTTINFSLSAKQYDSTTQVMTVEPVPFNDKGVTGDLIDYYHSITVNVADLGLPGDVIWIRTETTDNVNDPLFIPSALSDFKYVKYFAIHIN